jgi:hypothetical protein
MLAILVDILRSIICIKIVNYVVFFNRLRPNQSLPKGVQRAHKLTAKAEEDSSPRKRTNEFVLLPTRRE